jgi:hypothetical protein
LPARADVEPGAKAGWSLATRSHPAFRRQPVRFARKNRNLRNFRHPEGGREDVLLRATQGEKPAAELEIYRPGGESSESGAAAAPPSTQVDGVTGAQNPDLSGAL